MRVVRALLGLSLATALGLALAAHSLASSTHDARLEAIRLYKVGLYREALPYLDQVLERHPRDIELRNERGGVYLRLDQPAKAIPDFDVAIRLSPFYPRSYVNRGIARLMLGHLEAAREDMAWAARLCQVAFNRTLGDASDAHCGLGEVLMAMGQGEAALSEFSTAIQIAPGIATNYLGRAIAYNSFGEPALALADLDTAIRLVPNCARAYRLRAGVLAEQRQFERAQADFAEAIRLDPNDSEARALRGALLARLSKNDDALADMDNVAKLKPQSAPAHKSRGAVLVELGRYDEAIRELNEAIRLDPSLSTAYQNRGAAYNCLGQFDRALDDLNEAVKLNPKNLGAHNNRALAFWGLGKYQSAMEDLDEAVALDPEHSRLRLCRGNALAQLGALDRALADYNAALEQEPNLAAAHKGRGRVFEALGLFDRAADAYRAALAITPRDPFLYVDLARALRADDHWPEALAELDNALALDPHLPAALATRAWCLFAFDRAGAEDNARAAIERMRGRGPRALRLALIAALAARRDHNEDEAIAWLQSASSNQHFTGWPAPVVAYLQKQVSAERLVEMAVGDAARTEAHVWVGLDLLAEGERERAIAQLRRALELSAGPRELIDTARATLQRLGVPARVPANAPSQPPAGSAPGDLPGRLDPPPADPPPFQPPTRPFGGLLP